MGAPRPYSSSRARPSSYGTRGARPRTGRRRARRSAPSAWPPSSRPGRDLGRAGSVRATPSCKRAEGVHLVEHELGGTSSAPISASTGVPRRWSDRASSAERRVGDVRTRSATSVSSSVAANPSTSASAASDEADGVGQRGTASRRARTPAAGRIGVSKRRSSTDASAPVSAFRSVDFPTLVYRRDRAGQCPPPLLPPRRALPAAACAAGASGALPAYARAAGRSRAGSLPGGPISAAEPLQVRHIPRMRGWPPSCGRALELALGAALGEDVQDQLRPVGRAPWRVLDCALLGGGRSSSTGHSSAVESPYAAFALRLPLAHERPGSGLFQLVDSSPRERRRRCARARAAGELLRAASTALGTTPTANPRPAPPRVRGIGLARGHARIMPRYAPWVPALADRLAARTPRARRHSLAEPARAGDPRAPAAARAVGARPSGVGDEAALFVPRAAARRPSRAAGGSLRHDPGAGEPPRPHRRERRARARGQRHEGRPRRRHRVLGDLGLSPPASTSGSSCSGGRAGVEHNPLPALFAGSRAVHEASLAILLEPTGSSRPAASATSSPARLRGTEATAARPWEADSAIARAVEGLAGLLAPRRDVPVAGLDPWRCVGTPHAGIRRQRDPGRGGRDAQLPYPPDRTPEGAVGRTCDLVPDGATLEVTSSAPSGRVVSTRARPHLVEAGSLEVGPKQAWTNVADFTANGIDAVSGRAPAYSTGRAGHLRPGARLRGRSAFLRGAVARIRRDGARRGDRGDVGRTRAGQVNPSRSSRRSENLDREARVARSVAQEVGGQRVGQEGDPPLLPAAQGRANGLRRAPLRGQDPRQVGLSPTRGSRRPARRSALGSFLSEGIVLTPGYVNIGAWVGPRTMVDTWATVGSCAQIGGDVHLRRCRHRRRAGAAPGEAGHHRRWRLPRLAPRLWSRVSSSVKELA